MEVYRLDHVELQEYVNNAFNRTLWALHKEKYLTKAQVNELLGNYSIIIETSRWLPKTVSRWLGLKEDQLSFRLVRAVDREGAKDGDE